jgi:predicted Zn-dependent protease
MTMPETERMQQIRALLADDPADPFLRYGLAMEHASQGDDGTAAKHFRDLIAANPDYIPAYLMLGQTLVRLGDDDGTKDVLRCGIAAAGRAGNEHAQGEMQALLESLE